MSKTDLKEFSILKTVSDSGRPLWKKEIHRQISENIECLPIESVFSIQTVGRRVREMKEEGLLEEKFTKSKNVNRTIIKGYQVTDTGNRKLEKTCKDILHNWISNSLFSGKNEYSDRTIKELFCSHFDIPREICEEYQLDYLKKIVFLSQNTEFASILSHERFQEFAERLIEHNTKLKKFLTSALPESNLTVGEGYWDSEDVQRRNQGEKGRTG